MSNSQTEPNPSLSTVFFPMSNSIQNYAWGSTTSINTLFGVENASGEPQAEIWMGAHPNGCSEVLHHGEKIKLSDLIAKDMPSFLSEKVASRFAELPYLFKVLAAEKALSIQVHPNKNQAEEGFALEEKQGILQTAANRNFKDPNHKPELVYALTQYKAMNGFRSFEQILANFNSLDISAFTGFISELEANQNEAGLSAFFKNILSLENPTKDTALAALLDKAKNSSDFLMTLILELESQYPGDIGLFAPLMLNVIVLEPGDAMYLDAQTPHAYLKGTALEIMANSDNVLRAGLTPKYIDIDTLVACTLFKEMPFDSLLLKPSVKEGIEEYAIPVEDFKFAIIPSANNQEMRVESAEILFAVDSTLSLSHANGERCEIQKGQSVFIPAYAKNYQISAAGRVARAYC